ncbi:hypothetical protein M9H77_33609 [Catharanthus roseus]|uniref:Uncharacterized protein n=1 Tax=Catharanthus roseus TaxID=4058 RepID=A0ACB9ZJR2_CATRO|nr:hypothetical protein M9H77_33609 [Catharanthus roseus]
MEVAQVLHMNVGSGNTSYANNSSVQQKVILMTRAITEEAIADLYSSLLPKAICIADLGCSSGPNTLLAVSNIIKTVEKRRRSLGHKSPEYQIYLNDLPNNDFNNIFKSLSNFKEKLAKQMGPGFGSCFFSGVPGSFYGRLFPTKTLHFVHSSYSLMWLSKVPDLTEVNKGNIYLSRTSPAGVVKAYLKQFQRDFSTFLKCRAEELVPGGAMVLTLLGRRSHDHSSKESGYIYELLSMAINQLVSEGLIEEEKLDSFNIPEYTPSPAEVKYVVEEEGCFVISHLEATSVHWNASDKSEFSAIGELKNSGYNVAKCIRAVTESLLVSHFGKDLMDDIFDKFKEILIECMSKEKTEFINVTVSMKKRGQ